MLLFVELFKPNIHRLSSNVEQFSSFSYFLWNRAVLYRKCLEVVRFVSDSVRKLSEVVRELSEAVRKLSEAVRDLVEVVRELSEVVRDLVEVDFL